MTLNNESFSPAPLTKELASSRQPDFLNNAISLSRYNSLERAMLLNMQKAVQEQHHHQVPSVIVPEDTEATCTDGQQELCPLIDLLHEAFDIIQEEDLF